MTLRWGIIGASGIAHRRTMPAINMTKGNELHALMVRDIDRAEALAQEHGAVHYYASVDGLLSDPDVDAVYIAAPVYLHYQLALQAAQYRKHILCEKPMAMSVDECRHILDACQRHNAHLQICFLLRFHPWFHQIRNLIASGDLGQVIQARASLLKWYPIQAGLWRRDPARSGGGVLMDIGAHVIDLSTYLLGDVSKVAAFVNSRTTGMDVEETATVFMQTRSGAHVIVDTSFVVPHSGAMLEIYGTKGSVFVTGGPEWKMKTYLNDSMREESSPYENLYKPQVEHFSNCIDGQEEPLAPGIVGLKNIQIISAAYQAARTGKTIPILDHQVKE